MITKKQESDRAKGIGSSDVPTILGLNPWQTAYDLWLQKTGRVESQEENDAMHLGTMLEEPVLRLAADRLGQRVVRPSNTFVGCRPYCRANIDGMIGVAKRGSPIVEAKTTGKGDEWGEDGSDEVPERVRAQVMFQMACSSSDVAHIGALIGDYGLRFKMFRVNWDADYGAYIMERVEAFWERHVLTGNAPTNSLPSADAVKRMTRTQSETKIDSLLFVNEQAAKRVLADAESEYEQARARLYAALGQHTKGVSQCGGFTISVSTVETERFDTKQWAADNPELAQTYRIPSSHQRITVRAKGAKKGTA